ncbi:MAG: Eco57I restriction-modification methylase domain-containing protein [Micavibrio sp.]
MTLKVLTPRQSLNKSFLKVKPSRAGIDTFKSNLIHLLDQIKDGESEEFHKNIISRFLDKTYYSPGNYINTKDRNDLVIHNGKDANTSVGVIIEVKRPLNRAEMIQTEGLNAKAFQELLLYYMQERVSLKNLEIKHLVVTNIHEWFIFDAVVFEKWFFNNKTLVDKFEKFKSGQLSGKKTDFFYKEIAEPILGQILAKAATEKQEIPFTYFDLRAYQAPLRNADKVDDAKLIALYKLLSPEHLLKLPFSNDNNTLDKGFYNELLHIVGLEEVKNGGKKVIGRKGVGSRDSGSLLENTISHLDSLDKISRVDRPEKYGLTKEDRLYNIALELVITWVNRVLFLKLLEAQLISYHKGNKQNYFLNSDKIKTFDDLNDLFFGVLARRPTERSQQLGTTFSKVPYLNSSLFEPTNLEQTCLFASQLSNNETLGVLPNTVLKDSQGKKGKGKLSALEYLFAFLDSYDFGGDSAEEIQEENKTLINSAVLGLIFEKINGYKDGSFFTPGFITMFMSRETIRKAILEKFNEVKGWSCNDLNGLYNKIGGIEAEANEIINSLKICDPAVGSGHFLVSALNEIIAVKSELGILADEQGKKLRDYHVIVSNDELIVTDEDGRLFEYNPKNKESQRIQQTLFHEKQAIIERCLFGVDINENSVKICRLRLWIELLKNAYYTPGSNFTELETLPNIDINIKCGNSLVSRFPLDADLSPALKKSKLSIKNYKAAVQSYHHATNKEQKREMETFISTIKADFRTEISSNDPKMRKFKSKSGELNNLVNQHQLFELSKAEQKAKEKTREKLESEIKRLGQEIEEIKSNKVYEGAFEWRFEFPEILDEQGSFIGFDLVIGNPPYGIKFTEVELKYLKTAYTSMDKAVDSYGLFIEVANKVSKIDGITAYIVPTGWYSGANFGALRRYFAQNTDPLTLINLPYDVFADAWVDTTIFITKKRLPIQDWPRLDSHTVSTRVFDKKDVIKSIEPFYDDLTSLRFSDWFEAGSDEYVLLRDPLAAQIINKIRSKSKPLSEYADIQRGVTPFNLTPEPIHENSRPAFNGTIRKYKFTEGERVYIRFDNSLAEFKPEKYFKGERILLREIISRQFRLQAVRTTKDFVTNKSMQSIIVNDGVKSSYILAMINSRLLSWYFLNISQIAQRDDFPKIVLKETRNLPVFALDHKIHKDEYDKINQLVAKMETLQKSDLEADISSIEEEIDQIIFELYDLSIEERNLIKKSGAL